ncbi:eukaryotic translation initiation factor 5B [Malassezia sp. CBS 17886]|nr:eukaryotic translation initiation factor 5B [Malassezia sp. CBS 17886]
MGKKKGNRKDDDDPFADLGEDVAQNNVDAEEAPAPDGDARTDAGAAEPPAAALPDTGSDAPRDEDVPEPPKLLSKKEKERLKKEKEKVHDASTHPHLQAKKKQQSASKKTDASVEAGGADAHAALNAQDAAGPNEDVHAGDAAAAADGDDSDGAADAPGSSDKKKKKKKKKAVEPAPPQRKAPSAAVAALQARIAAQKKAEEEERAAEEAERRRLEEAEREEREEAERKEAERLRRKEKERAKREQLKKEGKLLTPKQKAEQKAAEARREALLRSGNISVAAMSMDSGDDAPKRRVVYDKRKKAQQKHTDAVDGPKKEAADANAVDANAADANAESAKGPPAEAPVESPAEHAEEGDVKDDWDAESDNGIKDDWDADSEEEMPKTQPKKATDTKGAPEKTDEKAAGKAGEEDDEEDEDEEAEGDDDDDDDDDDDASLSGSSEDAHLTSTQRMAMERRTAAEHRRKERTEQAMAARSKDDLRSPICCILGHVDTGKTKLLDKVRQTSVQEGEAGGITQQIGATYFPIDALKEKTKVLNDPDFEYKVPGLLVIDTPGHESFTNLRSRGSSLCNIAILVVDIMHGLEQQTLESLRLLRDKKTPFIVALNKVDRLYDWKATPNNSFRGSFAQQSLSTQKEFEERVSKTMLAFAEQGLNAELYYKNKNLGRYVSLVPTSAITGEGIPDMLQLLVALTQDRMSERLMYLSELQCTVLEVKVIEGLGTTIDVVLSNGVLREGEKIVVCGLNGPIVTHVRALLTPQPLKEMRVKGSYVHHKEVKAALGVKISATDLDKAVAGSRLLVCRDDDEEESLREEVMNDLTSLLNSVDKSGKGVCVQASTLGSLEALLEFLKQSKIPVSGINIGPVYKKDVMRCATMLEKARELACILCFDVPVDKDAERLADELGVKLFTADIIYHLFDSFMAYSADIAENKKRGAAQTAVWPCRLRTIAAFAKRDPIILGCDIIDGTLRVGTPLCVVKTDAATKKKEVINLGRVASLEINHKTRDVVQKKDVGAGVAVRIDPNHNEAPKMFGRHLDEKDEIYSLISRGSIDALKEHFWDGVTTDEKRLIKNLKSLLDIP